MIKKMTLSQASKRLAVYGLTPTWVGSELVVNGKWQAEICSFHGIPGYSIRWTIRVSGNPAGRVVEQINIY